MKAKVEDITTKSQLLKKQNEELKKKSEAKIENMTQNLKTM